MSSLLQVRRQEEKHSKELLQKSKRLKLLQEQDSMLNLKYEEYLRMIEERKSLENERETLLKSMGMLCFFRP